MNVGPCPVITTRASSLPTIVSRVCRRQADSVESSNGTSAARSAARAAGNSEDGQVLSGIPLDYSGPIGMKMGFREDVEPTAVYPDNTGAIRIRARELDKVELHFGPEKRVSGFLMVGDSPRPLPAGSTLDPKESIFYWQMGPAFVGEYALTFIETDKFGNTMRKSVLITIVPRFNPGRENPQAPHGKNRR